MSDTISKYSQAEIVRSDANSLIRLTEIIDLESIFLDMFQSYLLETGFHDKYPKFGNIRLSAVHPFALLLFQELADKKLDLSVFPSITVTDSNDGTTANTLGRDMSEGLWHSDDIAVIEGAIANSLVLVSDSNMARLKARVEDVGFVVYRSFYTRSQHNVDFNVWADNHIIKNNLYDITKHFLSSHAGILHRKYGVDFMDDINGHKSGDLNMDFGRILYGANLTAKLSVATVCSVVDINAESLQDFDIHDTHTNFYP